jgi:sporulation protein YlmC with PRC-barrel domain
MRLKELRGLPVIDPTAARKVGTVSDYQVDPSAGRLAALDVTPLDGGDGQRIVAQRIRRVGGSAVMLTARGGSMPSSPSELNERWLDTSTLVGLEVMSDDGTRVGHLVDAVFDQDSLAIETYLLQGSGLLDSLSGKRNRIEPEVVHSCSRELMLVSSGNAQDAAVVGSSETGETASTGNTASKPAASEDTAPLDASVPLKDADKLSTPSFEPVADGHPVSTSSS